MTSNMQDRVVIDRHLFVPSLYNHRRCSACGYGMERRDREGAVHTQAVEIQQQAHNEQAQLYMSASLADGGNDAEEFNTNSIAMPPPVERMKVGLAYQNQVISLEVPMDLWPAMSERGADTNWDLQQFIDHAADLIRETAGGIADVSAAHQVDHEHQMDAFRQHVAEVALRYGSTHDWCDEVLACLDEIGIQVTDAHVIADIRIPYQVELKLPYDKMKSYLASPSEWVEQRIEDLPFSNPELPSWSAALGVPVRRSGDGYVHDITLTPARVRK